METTKECPSNQFQGPVGYWTSRQGGAHGRLSESRLPSQIGGTPSTPGYLDPEPSGMHDAAHYPSPTGSGTGVQSADGGTSASTLFVERGLSSEGRGSPLAPASIRHLALSCAGVVNPSDAIGVSSPPAVRHPLRRLIPALSPMYDALHRMDRPPLTCHTEGW